MVMIVTKINGYPANTPGRNISIGEVMSLSSTDDNDDGGGGDDNDNDYRISKSLHLMPSCPSHPQGCALVLRLLSNCA